MDKSLKIIAIVVFLVLVAIAWPKGVKAPLPRIAIGQCSENALSLRHLRSYPTMTINWQGKPLKVWVADTPERTELGLSNTKCLPPDRGMLFLFSEPAVQQFWMKDMNYPIDMVWLDADLKEISRMQNADPANYPEIYSSEIPVSAVLEINATKNSVPVVDK